jgi:hypothetical protein
METTHKDKALEQRNPLLASLWGGYRDPDRRGRESTEESLRYPSELFWGFALGVLLGLLPIAAIRLFHDGRGWLPSALHAAAQPGTAGFWLFWIAAGLVTALLVTGGFVMAVLIPTRVPAPYIQVRGKAIPATGQKEEESGEDDREE